MDKHYIKDLKKAYRILKKEKNEYPKGDIKRIELNKKMKEIKEKLHKESGENMTDPQKQILIDKIIEFKKANRMAYSENMEKFSIDDLEFHYMKITGKITSRTEYNKLKGIVPAIPAIHQSKKQAIQTTEEPLAGVEAAHSPIEAGIRRMRRYKSY